MMHTKYQAITHNLTSGLMDVHVDYLDQPVEKITNTSLSTVLITALRDRNPTLSEKAMKDGVHQLKRSAEIVDDRRMLVSDYFFHIQITLVD